MPKLGKIALSLIDEPSLPIRISMDDRKMRDLVESMGDIGLLQPVGLKISGERYEIEYGHRRLIAARKLKWREIYALVFTARELKEGAAMLAENIEREDITAAEEAVLFAQAMELYKLDEAGLIKRFRKSASYIGSRLSLLRRDPEIFRAVQERRISFAVANELNRCTDEGHRRYLLDAAIRSGSGAGTIMSWVDQWKATAQPRPTDTVVFTNTPAPEPVFDESIACKLCGGYRDPYNLVSIYIHKWELEEILKIMRRGEPEKETPQQSAQADGI